MHSKPSTSVSTVASAENNNASGQTNPIEQSAQQAHLGGLKKLANPSLYMKAKFYCKLLGE